MKSLQSTLRAGVKAIPFARITPFQNHFTFALLYLFVISLSCITSTTAQTRIGLHVTQEELNIWRQRAKTGPYLRRGDVSANSPNDWERIKRQADDFVSNPGGDRFSPYSGSGCVPRWSQEPGSKGEKMRDAGFAYLITTENKYKDAVRNELMKYAANSNLDFSRTDKWCVGVMNDVNPGFFIAEWMNRLLVAYDYVRSSLSSDDRSRLDRWFANAGIFFQKEVDRSISSFFVNRAAENYTLSNYAINSGVSNATATAHYGSRKIPNLAMLWNNRRGSMIRLVAMVGIQQNNGSLKQSAKLYVKEFLKFSTFPDGVSGDFYRGSSSSPEQGWSYAIICVGQIVDIADHFARVGDTELYRFTTSTGMFGTEGGSKNILLTIKTMLNYLDGSVKRYATSNASHVGNSTYLIDGIHGSWISVNDNFFSQANVYYKDNYVKNAYLRRNSGTKQYPVSPSQPGPYLAWTGTGGIYPGKLFMFGQMEGRVWPYSGSGSTPPSGSNPDPVVVNPPAEDDDDTPPSGGSGSTNITVSASGSSAGGVFARFNVLVNGTKIGTTYTSNTSKGYNFSTNISLSSVRTVAVQFDNDANISGQDRNLFVKSITLGGKTYSSTGSNVKFDRDAIDGKEVSGGRDVLPWNGALIFTINSGGRRDYSLEDPELASEVISDLQLNPNPNDGVFSLDFDSERIAEEGAYIAVFDILGKSYYEEQISPADSKLSKRMDLSSIPEGMYLLKVRIGQEEIVKKFVKQ